MAFPLLNISPSQLEFLFEAERELKSTLNLRNVNEGVRVAFKIKTTNSERFVVCPPTGIVEPGTTRIVKIYLKAQRDYDEDLRLCKDRFLVQSIQVEEALHEAEVASSMFRSAQRQEAKLKVVVAAPLAHSSVLENEIRTIAQRQGIEGHRAAVRKFSELLLARGIISQAQVVLAFSTVGEIFQGMHGSLKVERDFDYNNIPRRPAGSKGAEPGSAENGAVALAAGSPGNCARADDFTPTPRAAAAPADGPFRLQSAALFTAVARKPELETASDRRRDAALFTAVGRAPAAAAAFDGPPPNGRAVEAVSTAMPEASDGPQAGAKEDAIYSSAGSGPLEAAAAAAPPPRTPPFASPADRGQPELAPRISDEQMDALFSGGEVNKAEVPPAVEEKAEVEPARKAPPTREATRYVTPLAVRRDAALSHSHSNRNGDGTAEDDTDLAFQHTESDKRPKHATKRLLRPRRTVGELKEAPGLAARADEPAAGKAADALAPGAHRPEGVPELPQLEKQQSLPGKANWPATADTLGRLNPVTRIDRLATPAYRKTSLPTASRRIDAVLANAQSSASADEELARRASTGELEGFASPAGSRELESQLTAGSVAEVPPQQPAAIPRGNTLKMATFFGRSRS